ncbi:protein seele [Condylostylus longicornis]|uniref:protein seele n=1 Tax=Condylostylus longicornis TaxID=2530218 RepID=UPI00244E2AC1|nr:protein seele [Condylostylus longicornis]
MSKFFNIILVGLIYFNSINCQLNTVEEEVDAKLVKCEVCKATVQEIENAVSKVDTGKKVDVGGFRIDAHGNTVSKSVQLSKSEVYLTELMEKICKRLEDYAKVKHKKTHKIGVIQMMVDGALNVDVSSWDFVQDGDLNKSLEHYCLEILDEFDESFTEEFMKETLPTDLDYKLCTERTKLCNDPPPLQDDYKLEDEL